MARQKAPAFRFYPRDYLADLHVQAMTYEQRGIFMQLLCLCWLEQSLPDDVAVLATVLKLPLKTLQRHWAKVSKPFVRRNGGLRHLRLDAERKSQAKWAAKCSLGGKIGAARRWGSRANADDKGSHPLVTPTYNQTMTLLLPLEEQEQEHEEQRLPPRSHPVENSRPNIRVLLRCAHELHGQIFESEADLKEALKTLYARYHLAYDATSIAAVLDLLKRSRRPLEARVSRPARRAGGAR